MRDLGTDRLTLRELGLIIKFAPSDSAIAASVQPTSAPWGLAEQLMAAMVDQLRVANWQRAGKGERPKPLPRPGIVDTETMKLGNGKGSVMTLAQAKEWRDKRRVR